MRLLLIGATGAPYYEHCEPQIREFLGRSARIGVITAANAFDETQYFQGVAARLTTAVPSISSEALHIRWDADWRDALDRVDGIVVPGGNTYLLLSRLQQSGLAEALQRRVAKDLSYIGSSAGANVAGPNILTTNDWNVVGLRDFTALNLVGFNINPHYVERSTTDAPLSETRDLRIREYHRFRANPVVAIEETAVVQVVDGVVSLLKGNAKVFRADGERFWMDQGKSYAGDDSLSAAAPTVRGSARRQAAL